MIFGKLVPAFAVCILVAACNDSGTVTSAANIDPISLAAAPPGAEPGTCWGKTITPAIVETVTRKIQLQPAQVSSDGRVQAPPIYKSETRQEVVQPRQETWFETICEDRVTTEFISSVQRALQARGYYRGAITGTLDGRTRTAISKYQGSEGVDSKVLTIAAARKLGLIAIPRSS